MRKALSLSLSVVALGACFGSGSPPTLATEATAVLVVEPQSMSCGGGWQYVGGVAFTPVGGSFAPVDGGYAVELSWQGPDCNGGSGGGGGNNDPIPVLQFGGSSSATGMAITGGSAGNEDGVDTPHLAVDPPTGTLAYAYTTSTNNGGGSPPDVEVAIVQPGGPPTMLGPQALGLANSMTPLQVAGMVVDATAAWVAVSQTGGNQPNRLDVNSPTFPCCQSVLATTSTGSLWRVGYGSGSLSSSELSPALSFIGGIAEPLVANTSTLFYVARAESPAIAELGAFPKTGTSDADRIHLATLDTSVSPDAVPVGLAADDQHVAWAASIDGGAFSSGASKHRGCWIWSVDLTQPLGQAQPQPLFTSTTLSCSSLAIDATSVYFAIVHVDDFEDSMVGDGIGRVSLADGTFESIAVDMAGDYAGPRRVYGFAGSDDSLYAIDPMVIGKLHKSALAGQHAF